MKTAPVPFRLVLAQINTTVGDFRANVRKTASAMAAARQRRADLIAFPEMTVTGYPPEDLLFKRSFIEAGLGAVRRLARLSKGLTAIVGFVDRDESGGLYNAAAVLSGGRYLGSYRKIELPNYGVFDEKRYFQSGGEGVLLEAGRARIGLSICEDIWLPGSFVYRAPYQGQTSLILNISASPYHLGKQKQRYALVRTLAQRTNAHVAYLNLVGGQDELVFDGGSLVASPDGRLLAEGKYLEEDLLTVDLALAPREGRPFVPGGHPTRTFAVHARRTSRKPGRLRPKKLPKPLSEEEEVYRALVLGTRDYIEKNGFKKALIGLSGGVDSALVARIAVDALGPSRVLGVTMPSRFTSAGTFRDAGRLARKLKIRILRLGIEKVFNAYLETLKTVFAGRKPDAAEENLQARVRGNLLMALSNKFGYLVLTTGNKSETATGYCTLYGDMAGGFAVIKDVPKTLVYRLARYRNARSPRNSIPVSILRRVPSAELRAHQKDTDTLPPYARLDAVLKGYIEKDLSVEELVRRGFARALVRKVAGFVDRNEYKRRQAPPGLKITPKAFGRDRRMPITNKFRP